VINENFLGITKKSVRKEGKENTLTHGIKIWVISNFSLWFMLLFCNVRTVFIKNLHGKVFEGISMTTYCHFFEMVFGIENIKAIRIPFELDCI